VLRTLLSLLRPLPEIARSLRLIAELYELELASRNPPVLRVTERPSEKDTEVLYAGVKDDRPLYKRWFEASDELEPEDRD
jgi:hypothetical protein